MDGVEMVKQIVNEGYSSFIKISPSMSEKTYTCRVSSATGNHTKEMNVKKKDVEFLLFTNTKVKGKANFCYLRRMRH